MKNYVVFQHEDYILAEGFTLVYYNTNVLQRKNGYNQGKQRANYKIEMEKREEMTRRTVYVSDIDQQVKISIWPVDSLISASLQCLPGVFNWKGCFCISLVGIQVTEEQLAALFLGCGQVYVMFCL